MRNKYAIARRRLLNAFYASYNSLHVVGIVDAIEKMIKVHNQRPAKKKPRRKK